jgi:hypothetical protein
MIAAYINEALESEDASAIAVAIGTVARARGMSAVAEKTGLSRENLYRHWAERRGRNSAPSSRCFTRSASIWSPSLRDRRRRKSSYEPLFFDARLSLAENFPATNRVAASGDECDDAVGACGGRASRGVMLHVLMDVKQSFKAALPALPARFAYLYGLFSFGNSRTQSSAKKYMIRSRS